MEEKQTTAKDTTAKSAVATQENNLSLVSQNPELAKMYQANAHVGAENLSGAAPYLKVHSAGKSTTNYLADGKKPTDGFFFYQPTQEQFETLTCHILTISKGFRAEGMSDKEGEKKMVYNQIIGGVIVDNGDYKPFLMYMTGTKLAPMWEFGKEASKWTKAKPLPIPMFALTVNLSTHEEKTPYGFSWVIDFEIAKEDDGSPKLVVDAGEFQFLKDSVETTQETINSLIANKTSEVVAEPIVGEDMETDTAPGLTPSVRPTTQDDEVADDIPF